MAGQRMRQLRGMEIVAWGGQVKRIADSKYLVRSQRMDAWYGVKLRNGRWLCECADYIKRRKTCKHAYAVIFLLRLPKILDANSGSVFHSFLKDTEKGEGQIRLKQRTRTHSCRLESLSWVI